MDSVIEIVSLVGIGGVMLQSAAGLSKSWRRRAMTQRQQRSALDRFREKTQILLLETRQTEDQARPGWYGFRKFRVDRKVRETESVVSLHLKPYDGQLLPGYLPGQHLTFRFQIPGRPRPVIRCYSLSEAPGQADHYRVTIKRLGSPGDAPETPEGVASCFVHDRLSEGDIVDIRAPNGHFTLDMADRRPIALIAGGIGLTPLLSMINAVAANPTPRETWLFYGVRNRAEHVMRDHLRKLTETHDHIHVVVCYSQPTDDCIEGEDYDHKGWIDTEMIRDYLPDQGFQFFVCGPSSFQESVTKGLSYWGVPEGDIHFETFGQRRSSHALSGAEISKVIRAALAANQNQVPFDHGDIAGGNGANGGLALAQSEDAVEVVFARSGKVVHWTPGDAPLLDLAEAVGIPLDSGCRAGQCGTCATPIKSGEVSYLVKPASETSAQSCLTCVAIPKGGGLVLDA